MAGASPLAPEDQYELSPDPGVAHDDALAPRPTPTPAPTPAPNQAPPEPKGVPPRGAQPSFYQQLKQERAARQQAQREQFDPENFQPEQGAASYGTPEPPPKTSALADFGRQAWVATAQMGHAALGAASFAARQLGADPTTVGYLEDQKAHVADYVTNQVNKLSPAAREAMHASLFGGKDDEGKDLPSPNDVGWGHYIGANVASMIPQVALAVLPGGLVGRVAGKLAATAVTAGGFGAQSAGEAYNAIVDAVDKAKPDELMRSPAYKELRDQGTDDIEARRQLVRSIAPGFVAAHFGVGAIAGAGLGEILGSGAAGAAGRSVFARAGVGAAEGAATMGGQAGAENALDQKAQQQAGVRTEFDPTETARAFASGALGGAALGAGGGMLHGGKREAPRSALDVDAGAGEPRPPTPIPPAEAAALRTALDGGAGGAGGNPEAGGPIPHLPTTAAPPDVGAWPHPNAELRPQPMWPHPSDPDAPPAPMPPAPVAPRPIQPAQVQPVQVQPAQAQPTIDATRQPPVADPAAQAAQPTPAATPPASRVEMIRELVGAGVPKKGLAAKKLAELRDMVDEVRSRATPDTAPAPEAAEKPVQAAMPEAGPEVPQTAETAAPSTPVGEAAPMAQAMRAAQPEAAQAAGREAAPTLEVPPGVETPAADTTPETPAEPPKAEATPVVEPAAPTPTPAPKSKRQLAKERLAAPTGSRMKGEVATLEAATPAPEVTTGKAGKTFDEARKEALQHVQRVARNDVTPIKKGDLPRVMERVARELHDAIHAGGMEDQTEGRVHEAIATWGKSSKDPIPGTTTRRGPIADRVLQLMTGKGLSRDTGRAAFVEDASRSGTAPRERSADADTQASRMSADETPADERGGEHLASEASATTEAAPATTNYDANEKARSTESGKARTAGDLLAKVFDGTMSVREAHEAYGEKKPGTVGRSRTFKDFGAYLDDRIAHAEDPAHERAALEQLARTQTDKGLTPQKKAANTEKLNALLAETGTERAAELRKLKAELEDPVGAAVTAANPADAEPRIYSRDANVAGVTGAGIAPQASRYVRMASDPRVNRAVRSLLLQHDEAGSATSSHAILRAIVNSGLIKQELRPLRELAGRLLKVAPDLPVMTHERAEQLGLAYGHGASGVYVAHDDGRPSHIALATDMLDPHAGHVEVALHEIVHSVAAAHIEQSLAVGGRDAKLLAEIGNELSAHWSGNSVPGLDREALQAALQSPHELHTLLMSNPSVQAFAARTPVSDAFRARMADLGYPAAKGRSIWQAFTDWVRRALGMGPAGSASEATLLDHILRPMQDITDRGAEFNRRAFDRAVPDPVVRSYAYPALRATGGRLGDAAGRALDRVDPMGLGDRARRGALMGATTDGIVDWNRRLFEPSDRLAIGSNPIERFRSAQEDIQHVTKQAWDTYADRASSIAQSLQREPRLGPLMNDATIAGVRLGRDREGAAADNSHLTTPEQQASLRELQARFDRLGPDAQATYGKARDLYEQWHRIEREERLSAITRMAMPDITKDQADAIASALKTKRGTEAFLKSGESDALAQSFGAAWAENRALVRGVAKIHSMGFVPGDYFPLRRYGDYVVRYGEGDTLGVEMFERRGEAEARRTELLRSGADNLSQVMSKRESKQRDLLPSTTLTDAVTDKVRNNPALREHAEALHDLLTSTVLEYASRSEATRTQLRRKGVAGASIDAPRVLAQEFVGHGARLGHLMHDPDRNQALRHMRLVVDDLGRHGAPGDQIKAQAALHELEQRLTTGDDAQGVVSGIARKASTLGFVQSLMSPSHMLTSTIEAHMNSSSLLGARHGVGRAGLALTKALLDVSPKLLGKGIANTLKAAGRGMKAADWNLAHVARDRLIAAGADRGGMTALFGALDRAGLIDHSMEREMRRIANPSFATTGVGRMWQRFLDLNSAGAHAVDVANKSAIAKAAYDLELREGGSQERAVAYAVDTVRKSAPNYNLGNKARIATTAGPLGGFAAPITQFKQYGIHMYSVMANLTRESMHGATAADRREARKAMAGILATHALMAGSLTLIADPLRYVGGAWDFMAGADKPHDYQNDVRSFLADTFGPEVGELVARGLPHAAGIDIHRRVGLGNLLEIPELKSFDKKGVLEMLATAMTGAAGEDAAAMVGGMQKLVGGDVLAGIEGLVPRVLRDPMKAQRLADQGVVDSRGKPILPAARLSGFDVAAQAVGFQPARVSEFREGRAAVQEAQAEVKGEHDRLSRAWLAADPTDRAGVMSQIREFNMAHPGEAITMAALIRGLQERVQAARTPANFGLRIPPKAAPEFVRAGRFANVQ